MAKLNTKVINSFTDYINFVENLRNNSNSPKWYRGCSRANHELKPSLYRHKGTKSIEDFMQLEDKLIAIFKQRSIPFHDRTITEQWELLFFMQHYGIPTRLLDWSESPFIALFFAVIYSQYKLNIQSKPIFDGDVAVWILDPIMWNKHAINLKSFEDKILTTDDSNVTSYKPVGDCNAMQDYPIALYGAHNSQRIVAQRGVFVCFGKDISSMEKIYLKNSFPMKSLTKLIIKRNRLTHFYDAIRGHGIVDSVAFPDLDGLSCEIKRQFKFEV